MSVRLGGSGDPLDKLPSSPVAPPFLAPRPTQISGNSLEPAAGTSEHTNAAELLHDESDSCIKKICDCVSSVFTRIGQFLWSLTCGIFDAKPTEENPPSDDNDGRTESPTRETNPEQQRTELERLYPAFYPLVEPNATSINTVQSSCTGRVPPTEETVSETFPFVQTSEQGRSTLTNPAATSVVQEPHEGAQAQEDAEYERISNRLDSILRHLPNSDARNMLYEEGREYLQSIAQPCIQALIEDGASPSEMDPHKLETMPVYDLLMMLTTASHLATPPVQKRVQRELFLPIKRHLIMVAEQRSKPLNLAPIAASDSTKCNQSDIRDSVQALTTSASIVENVEEGSSVEESQEAAATNRIQALQYLRQMAQKLRPLDVAPIPTDSVGHPVVEKAHEADPLSASASSESGISETTTAGQHASKAPVIIDRNVALPQASIEGALRRQARRQKLQAQTQPSIAGALRRQARRELLAQDQQTHISQSAPIAAYPAPRNTDSSAQVKRTAVPTTQSAPATALTAPILDAATEARLRRLAVGQVRPQIIALLQGWFGTVSAEQQQQLDEATPEELIGLVTWMIGLWDWIDSIDCEVLDAPALLRPVIANILQADPAIRVQMQEPMKTRAAEIMVRIDTALQYLRQQEVRPLDSVGQPVVKEPRAEEQNQGEDTNVVRKDTATPSASAPSKLDIPEATSTPASNAVGSPNTSAPETSSSEHPAAATITPVTEVDRDLTLAEEACLRATEMAARRDGVPYKDVIDRVARERPLRRAVPARR